MIRAVSALFLIFAGPALAADLQLPASARQTTQNTSEPDRFTAPLGAFQNGEMPTVTLEGTVRRAAWKIASPGLTPLQIIRPLRDQLEAQGYELALDCNSDACGGFDFRFAVETLPSPDMYVNIRAYHYLTALRGGEGAAQEVVTVLASTTATSAYVQIIKAGGRAGRQVAAPAKDDVQAAPVPVAQSDLGAALQQQGHVVLSDLDFDSGTTRLGPGPFATLTALAAFMTANPDLRVALVGHTDTVGSLEANIAVSRRRAQSVRDRLIKTHSIAANRLDAEGMGYLSPVASNLDAAGRDANRRVEAILLGR